MSQETGSGSRSGSRGETPPPEAPEHQPFLRTTCSRCCPPHQQRPLGGGLLHQHHLQSPRCLRCWSRQTFRHLLPLTSRGQPLFPTGGRSLSRPLGAAKGQVCGNRREKNNVNNPLTEAVVGAAGRVQRTAVLGHKIPQQSGSSGSSGRSRWSLLTRARPVSPAC